MYFDLFDWNPSYFATDVLCFFMTYGIIFDALLISVLYVISNKTKNLITKNRVELYAKRYLCATGVIVGILIIFSAGYIGSASYYYRFEGTIAEHYQDLPEAIKFGSDYNTYTYQTMASIANRIDTLGSCIQSLSYNLSTGLQIIALSLGTIISGISTICLFKCKKTALVTESVKENTSQSEYNKTEEKDDISQLKYYKELLIDEVISQEEFDLKKKQILDL